MPPVVVNIQIVEAVAVVVEVVIEKPAGDVTGLLVSRT
jgi:hypothetical protein